MELPRRPVVVGIIGGIASGKSEVAKQLVARGALRIDADALGHRLLNEDPVIQQQVIELLGTSILNGAQRLDRRKIAAMVFGTDSESQRRLASLEAILHPAIRRLAENELQVLRKEPGIRLIVLDAPLLMEAHWHRLCDEIVFVDTPLERRQQFAVARGWSPDELSRREAAQMSLDEKRAAATIVVENDGDIEALRKEIDAMATRLGMSIPL